MNKTININLAGIIFHLDEEAYAKLTAYLKSIKSKFNEDSGRDEILSDIEARIAELFSNKLSSAKEVISLADVEEVIKIMGNPEDYDLEDDEEEKPNSDYNTKFHHVNFGKRLYRNTDEKVIGGVSSGIAAYFGMDPIWIRLTWLILFFTWGFGLLAYIILWIAMPEARTTTQKLQMRGEPINISNIEKSVKDEFKNVSDHVSKVAKDPKFGKNISKSVDDILQVILSIVKFVLALVLKVIGVALLVAGVFLLITFVGGLLGHEIIINDNMFGWYDLNTYIDHLLVSDGQRSLLFIALFMLAIAPIVWLFLFGVRILFNKRNISKAAFVVSGAISLIGFIVLVYIGGSLGRDFSHKSYVNTVVEVEQVKSKSYTLSLDNTINRPTNELEDDFDWVIQDDIQFIQNITFTIKKSDDNSMYLKAHHEAHGRTKKAAHSRAKKIEYNFDQIDSTLLFGNYFYIPSDEKFRNQNLELILFIPVGTTIYIDEDLMEIIYDIPNVTRTLDENMLNHSWLMTRNGLACLDCSADEMEDDFEKLWEEQIENEIEEFEDSFEELEDKRKELKELEKKLEKRRKELEKIESQTSSNNPIEPVFLPINSIINQEKNSINGFRV